MTRVLSISEIRRWLAAQFTRGKDMAKTRQYRELPTRAFCRTVGLNQADMVKVINGTKTSALSPRLQRVISRFIADWEAGMLEFGSQGLKRILIHRETPKRRPARMTVIFDDGPKLRMLARLPSSPGRIFLTAKAK